MNVPSSTSVTRTGRIETSLPLIHPKVRRTVSADGNKIGKKSPLLKACIQPLPTNFRPITLPAQTTPSTRVTATGEEEKTFVIQSRIPTRSRTVSDVAMREIHSDTQALSADKLQEIAKYVEQLTTELTFDEIKAFSKLMTDESVEDPSLTTFPEEVIEILEEIIGFLRIQLTTSRTAYRYFKGEVAEYIEKQGKK